MNVLLVISRKKTPLIYLTFRARTLTLPLLGRTWLWRPLLLMLRRPLLIAGYAFPTYRLVVVLIALFAAIALYLLMDRTRLGAMIRAGVDDMEMARGVGIPVSLLFTVVFLLGAVLAGAAGAFGN